MSLAAYLAKAVLTSPFDEATGTRSAGALPPEAAEEFIRVAQAATVVLKEATNRINRDPQFEIPRIDFSGRVLHVGTEGARLAAANRFAPTRQLVTMSTHLFRAELDVTPEFLEDNIEREGAARTLMEELATAVGRDAEEFAIKSDTARLASEDTDLRSFDGIIKLLQSELPTAQKVDATGVSTYNDLFSRALKALPAQYKQNPQDLRIYVPYAHLEGYRVSLAARGTPLGDRYLSGDYAGRLPFWGIDVVGVPLLAGTSTINGADVDYGTYMFLIPPKNIYVGWHREVRIESTPMPWEGIIGYFASLRYDVKIADPNAAVLVYNVPATLS